jgi:hypothetical protein
MICFNQIINNCGSLTASYSFSQQKPIYSTEKNNVFFINGYNRSWKHFRKLGTSNILLVRENSNIRDEK